MGSGCTSSCNDWFQKLTPDTGVRYTGPAIPSLGICTGDLLSEIEAVLIQKIVDYSTGVGIVIDIDLTTCEAFASCIACCDTCQDLPCILECYKNAICEIFGTVDDIDTILTDLTTGYNTDCLTGVTTNSTLKQIIQALINQYCDLVDAVTTLQTTVNNLNISTTIGDFLLDNLTTCQGTGTMIKSGTGSSAAIRFQGFVPIGAIIPYAGPTAGKFDSTGLGLANTDACGFALCNGNNGTVDMREQVPVGVGAGVMGGGTLPSNASGANYALFQLVGAASVTLSAAQSGTGAHNHTANFTHSHQFGPFWEGASDATEAGTTNGYMKYIQTSDNINGPLTTDYADVAPFNVAHVKDVTLNITTSTFAGAAASQAHENRQPSRALLYIQRIA